MGAELLHVRAVEAEDETFRADGYPVASRRERDRADPVGGELERDRRDGPGGAAVGGLQHGALIAHDPALLAADEDVEQRAALDRRRNRRPRGAAVLRAQDDRVESDGDPVLRVTETHAEERALHRCGLLVPGPAAVLAREHDAELADLPGVVGVAEAEAVEVDVAGLDAGVERALRQLDVLPDPHRRPGRTAVLGVDHRAVVAGAVAPLRGGELEREDVALRAGVLLGPGSAGVLGGIHDAFLAGDPRGLGVQAAHGEKGPFGVGILLLPRDAAVAGPEDAAQLAHHPPLLIAREAGGEEILVDLGQIDLTGAGCRRAGDDERGDDELHADPPRCSGTARAEPEIVPHGQFRALQVPGGKCQRRIASDGTIRALSGRSADQKTYSAWKRKLSLSRTVPNCCAATDFTEV